MTETANKDVPFNKTVENKSSPLVERKRLKNQKTIRSGLSFVCIRETAHCAMAANRRKPS